MSTTTSNTPSSDPGKDIEYWLQYINCAIKHPPLPSGSHAYQAHLNTLPDLRDLYHCLYKLYTEEGSAVNFREPVNALEPEVLSYYQVVDQPMSLRVVLDRIVEGKTYTTPGQILDDVELIWRNCETFNGPNSTITAGARNCAAAFDRIRQRYEEEKPAPKAEIDEFYNLMQKHGSLEVNQALLEYFEKNDPGVLVEGEVLLDSLTNKHLRAIIRIVEQFTQKDS
ncbi:unnamed protein product [Phytomonas sp. Hart1]|nr:unnamed protein product [Phytomonas sp. Hart1]|eukprot:CCW69285.1 unnamed protein product [Phytomonas sp. isolate Hart1]